MPYLGRGDCQHSITLRIIIVAQVVVEKLVDMCLLRVAREVDSIAMLRRINAYSRRHKGELVGTVGGCMIGIGCHFYY